MPETRENVESTEVYKEPLEKEKTIQDSNCTRERQRNSYVYDTSQFAWRRPLSCQLATGRLGDMLSVECILDMLERETDV